MKGQLLVGLSLLHNTLEVRAFVKKQGNRVTCLIRHFSLEDQPASQDRALFIKQGARLLCRQVLYLWLLIFPASDGQGRPHTAVTSLDKDMAINFSSFIRWEED